MTLQATQIRTSFDSHTDSRNGAIGHENGQSKAVKNADWKGDGGMGGLSRQVKVKWIPRKEFVALSRNKCTAECGSARLRLWFTASAWHSLR